MRFASKSLFSSARFFGAAPMDRETLLKVNYRIKEKLQSDFKQDNNRKLLIEIRRKALIDNRMEEYDEITFESLSY